MVVPDEQGGDLAELLRSGAQPFAINAPYYYASALNISRPGNDLLLTLSRPIPVTFTGGASVGEIGAYARNDVMAYVGMSVQSAKDLLLLLQDQIAAYEDDFGPIETEFTRRRSKAATSPQ